MFYLVAADQSQGYSEDLHHNFDIRFVFLSSKLYEGYFVLLLLGLPEFVCKSAGQTLYGIDDMYSFEVFA